VQHIEKRIQRVSSSIQEQVSITHSNQLEEILEQGALFDILLIDSIQTIQSQSLEGQSGSPAQVRYCADQFVQLAKATNTTVIIIGHVTKGGEIAGPKYLEHIVDMVCYLEGDRLGEYRFLRTKKNRFGSTDETAIFHMEAHGLAPAHHLPLHEDHHNGMVYSIGIDNGRPILIQIEMLVSKTKGKYPQRVGIGISTNRLDLIIAIVEKYCGINLSFSDVYINIPGEIEFLDSGIDLAIALGLFLQYKNLPSPTQLVIIGELGLGGQLIAPRQANKRIQEIPKQRNTIDRRDTKHISNAIKKIS
jgi:DNA repair protein RadA/Sms